MFNTSTIEALKGGIEEINELTGRLSPMAPSFTPVTDTPVTDTLVTEIKDDSDTPINGDDTVAKEVAFLKASQTSLILAIDALNSENVKKSEKIAEMQSQIDALVKAVENFSSPPKPSFKEAALKPALTKPVETKSKFKTDIKPALFQKLLELARMMGFTLRDFEIRSPQTDKPSDGKVEEIVESYGLYGIPKDADFIFAPNVLDKVRVVGSSGEGKSYSFGIVRDAVRVSSLIRTFHVAGVCGKGGFPDEFMMKFEELVNSIMEYVLSMNWIKPLYEKNVDTSIKIAHIIHFWNKMFPIISDTPESLFRFNIQRNRSDSKTIKVMVYIEGMDWPDEHLPSYEGELGDLILAQIKFNSERLSSGKRKAWKRINDSFPTDGEAMTSVVVNVS